MPFKNTKPLLAQAKLSSASTVPFVSDPCRKFCCWCCVPHQSSPNNIYPSTKYDIQPGANSSRKTVGHTVLHAAMYNFRQHLTTANEKNIPTLSSSLAQKKKHPRTTKDHIPGCRKMMTTTPLFSHQAQFFHYPSKIQV